LALKYLSKDKIHNEHATIGDLSRLNNPFLSYRSANSSSYITRRGFNSLKADKLRKMFNKYDDEQAITGGVKEENKDETSEDEEIDYRFETESAMPR